MLWLPFWEGRRTSYYGVAVRQATQPQSKPPHVTSRHVPKATPPQRHSIATAPQPSATTPPSRDAPQPLRHTQVKLATVWLVRLGLATSERSERVVMLLCSERRMRVEECCGGEVRRQTANCCRGYRSDACFVFRVLETLQYDFAGGYTYT